MNWSLDGFSLLGRIGVSTASSVADENLQSGESQSLAMFSFQYMQHSMFERAITIATALQKSRGIELSAVVYNSQTRLEQNVTRKSFSIEA